MESEHRAMTSAEKEAEERKRDRHMTDQQWMLAFQSAVSWFEAQQPTPRNSKAAALANQAKHIPNAPD